MVSDARVNEEIDQIIKPFFSSLYLLFKIFSLHIILELKRIYNNFILAPYLNCINDFSNYDAQWDEMTW